MSAAPGNELQYSAELLTALDPTARFASLCTGKDRGSMRAKLMLAAAVV
jgi:hypothetical protein